MSALEVKVPDIGDFTDVPIIEVFVKPGDTVAAEDSLITLESDKATMDVPSPSAGTVKEVRVKLGDKVSEGTLIAVLDAEGGAARTAAPTAPKAEAPRQAAPAPAAAAAATAPAPAAPAPAGGVSEVKVPDIGDFTDVPVIEVFVKPGDVVKIDDPLCTLESDKATMDVPSPVAGTVRSVAVKVGDKVSQGSPIVVVDVAMAAAPAAGPAKPASGTAPAPAAAAPSPSRPAAPAQAPAAPVD